jgi:hypothetical protein
MKKIILLFLVIFLMLFHIVSVGDCAENKWGQTDLHRLLKKVMPGYLQAAGTSFDESMSLSSSQSEALGGYNIIYKDISSTTLAGNTGGVGTLANGTKGEVTTILITNVGVAGDTTGEWVLTPTTRTGFESLTFDAQSDRATLLYVDDTTGWIYLSSDSVTVTYPSSGNH